MLWYVSIWQNSMVSLEILPNGYIIWCRVQLAMFIRRRKENNSLRFLAGELFDQGDVERAYNYMNVSIEDANFYGTRLRNIQNAHILPRIFSAYIVQQHTQRMHIFGLLVAVSVVAIALIVAVFLYLEISSPLQKDTCANGFNE